MHFTCCTNMVGFQTWSHTYYLIETEFGQICKRHIDHLKSFGQLVSSQPTGEEQIVYPAKIEDVEMLRYHSHPLIMEEITMIINVAIILYITNAFYMHLTNNNR